MSGAELTPEQRHASAAGSRKSTARRRRGVAQEASSPRRSCSTERRARPRLRVWAPTATGSRIVTMCTTSRTSAQRREAADVEAGPRHDETGSTKMTHQVAPPSAESERSSAWLHAERGRRRRHEHDESAFRPSRAHSGAAAPWVRMMTRTGTEGGSTRGWRRRRRHHERAPRRSMAGASKVTRSNVATSGATKSEWRRGTPSREPADGGPSPPPHGIPPPSRTVDGAGARRGLVLRSRVRRHRQERRSASCSAHRITRWGAERRRRSRHATAVAVTETTSFA